MEIVCALTKKASDVSYICGLYLYWLKKIKPLTDKYIYSHIVYYHTHKYKLFIYENTIYENHIY